MARKKSIIKNEPLILSELRKRADPILETRPDGSLSMKEMADTLGVSVDVVRRQLVVIRQTGALREARVRMERGYTVVYWLE